MAWRILVEIVAVLIMAGGVGGIFYGMYKHNIALSTRTIQFLAVAFALPVVLILSLERAIGNEASAALIGTIVGFAISGLTRSE